MDKILRIASPQAIGVSDGLYSFVVRLNEAPAEHWIYSFKLATPVALEFDPERVVFDRQRGLLFESRNPSCPAGSTTSICGSPRPTRRWPPMKPRRRSAEPRLRIAKSGIFLSAGSTRSSRTSSAVDSSADGLYPSDRVLPLAALTLGRGRPRASRRRATGASRRSGLIERRRRRLP